MREIRGGVFQGRSHNLLISKNNAFWAPQISRITFQVVTFHCVDDYDGASQTTTIHSLSNLLPQEGNNSGVLEEKEDLLERLGIYVASVRKQTVEQEEFQRLTRMVAALDDPETCTRIINDDSDALEDCGAKTLKAMFPQPQTGVVETVDTDKWTTTIATMERLLAKVPSGGGSLKTLLEQYQHLLTSLCYLESHGQLPFNVETGDLQATLHTCYKKEPKKTADDLFPLMEQQQRGLTIPELVPLTRNIESHVSKIIAELETQERVCRYRGYGRTGKTVFYAVSAAMLKGNDLGYGVRETLEKLLIKQGTRQLDLMPAEAFHLLSQDGRERFTDEDILKSDG